MTIDLIQHQDIKEGAKFKTGAGVVWIIDDVVETEKYGIRVRTSMEPGAKGNYRDDLEAVVDFLNEEKAVKIS